MRIGILFGLLVFFACFYAFWNIKRWNWSTVKIVSMAGLCGIASGGILSVVIYFLILLG